MAPRSLFSPVCAALGALCLLTAAGPSAFAQNSTDLRPLYDRIERLQRDVDGLQRQLARGSAPATGSGASAAAAGSGVSTDYMGRTEDRFAGIDDQVRDLTGKIEQLSHQISEATSRLDKLVSDVDFRLSALEKGAAPAQSGDAAPGAQGAAQAGQNAGAQQRLVLVPGSPAGQAAAAPAVQLPQGSPEAQYEFAYGLLLQAQREQSDFTRPEQALRAFIAANPNHKLAGNAQYWLGETYYVRRDYQSAAATFAEGLQKYPKSDKAPDNLVKLGMTLGQLNRKPEACGTLAEVDKRYPSAPAQIKQTAQRERVRFGCT
jgi:tol-pal system protein YbgF